MRQSGRDAEYDNNMFNRPYGDSQMLPLNFDFKLARYRLLSFRLMGLLRVDKPGDPGFLMQALQTPNFLALDFIQLLE